MDMPSPILGTSTGMTDPFGRKISYLRLSVTDRCDFRCFYCMPERMKFLPRDELLSLEELERLASVFIKKGVKRIRLTGGEPLVRRDILQLIQALGAKVKAGELDEITLTTNGSQLAKFAKDLAAAGVRRLNVSLDSFDEDRFAKITRRGKLEVVLDGIEKALAAGMAIKLNMVALKGINEDEFDHAIRWCGERGADLTLIETMPLGDIGEKRERTYLPLSEVQTDLAERWTLTPSAHKTGGPARYFDIAETGCRIGMITPLSHNFCASCNRVRVTCTGIIYMCLGQEDKADLLSPLRASPDDYLLEAAIDDAIGRKPEGHDFIIDDQDRPPAVKRHMNMTGG